MPLSLDCINVKGAMNPCRCGYFPDRKRCRCTLSEIRQYMQRISRPLLDRIDISVEVKPCPSLRPRRIWPRDSEELRNLSHEQYRLLIPFAIGRNNWKSIDGGITLGYYYSLTETAKANGAVPFYYLKFLFERLPKLFRDTGGKPAPELFDDLMPWTEMYRAYEAAAIEASHRDLIRLGKICRSAESA